MNKIFTQLLEKRHLDESFLNPKYENLTDPMVLPDIKAAIARIKTAISKKEKVLIYGDYDVDGVTASTLMEQTLILAGLPAENIEIMLPNRFTDGYGMSPQLVFRAKSHGVTLVITVDCGSRNHEIIDALAAEHIDTIVTDHHECGETLPKAIAVVNPKRPDYTGPATLKDLAGVGVAFKLAEALTRQNLIKPGQEKWLLDLVLLGTICDQMTLTGENRILGYYGIKVLEKTRRAGLKELLRTAGIKTITSESVGFQLGPRLNAAGRLDTADLSLNLLRTASATEAASLAAKLEELNKRRRTEQQSATKEIAARGITKDPVIIETGNWHEGILGIVAGHLVEDYHKPAFVLTEVENGVYKGSGRSFGDFSLAEALKYASDTIVNGGGHAGAAGVRIEAGNLDAFRAKVNEYCKSLHLTNQERFLKLQPDLTIDSLADFSLDLLDDLKLLEPYGPGNEEPLFLAAKSYLLETRRMGDRGQHLRLDIKASDNKILKTIAFSAPESWFTLDPSEPHDFLIKPIENLYRGTRSIEARLIAVD